ncbi:MAG: amidohydrolase family protein [Clostridia bacterium]
MKVFTNANINPITSPKIVNGMILIDQGKIVEVGKNIDYPANTEIIDLEGSDVYPGFIDGHSHLGVNERAIGSVGRDGHDETSPCTPHFRVCDGANPNDDAFDIALKGGITTAILSPSSGIGSVVPGMMTAIKTFGNYIDDMIIKEQVAIRCTLGPAAKFPALIIQRYPSSRTSLSAVLREVLLKTMQYKAKKDSNISQPFSLAMEAMLPVINKEIPLVVHANLKEDIFTAIRIKKEYDVNLVLLFVAEGHLIADQLASEDIEVLVGPVYQGHTRPEFRYHSKEVAAVLSNKGFDIGIIGNSGNSKSDSISIQASLAINEGLDRQKALEAITINPAKIYNISDKVGSIEVGKDADFVVCQGDLFSRSAIIKSVYVNGRLAYSKN